MPQVLPAPRARTAAPALREVTAAILAGGLGTRLRPALADRPKVLAPVAGRPFLCRLLDVLEGAGIRRTVLLTGHLAEQVQAAAGTAHGQMTLAYTRECAPLGTGGALRLALPLLPTPAVLVLNGDSYCRVNLRAFAAWHQRRRADVTMVLAQVADAGAFGSVDLDFKGIVRGFGEKQASGPGWVNAGIYLLRPELIEEIPADRAVSLEKEIMPRWVASKRVVGYRSAAPLFDIGTPASYARAQRALADTPRPAASAKANGRRF